MSRGSILGFIPVNTFAGSFSNSSIQTGWTIGGGVEARLMDNWSAKAEYLYLDLGSVADTFNTVGVTGAGAGAVVATRTYNSDIREHIFRFGLNYKLNGLISF
jgi:outer membrane immunogenic protein